MYTTVPMAIVAALGALLVSLSPVLAADTPNAEQIIRSLEPAPGGAGLTTRGIRLGGQPSVQSPSRPASTGGAVPSSPAPREANLSVPFATGSAEISPVAAHVLDQLGEALASPRLAAFKFRVEGHTDTVGQPDFNRVLSEQRAVSVIGYLAAKYNIDRSRLTPAGMGQDGLLVETGPGVPSAANRRVLVVNLGQ